MNIGLFDDILVNTKKLETIKKDDNKSVHRYKMKDGTIYEVPYREDRDYRTMAGGLLEKPMLFLPNSSHEIEQLCKGFLEYMRSFLEVKEFYRYNSYMSNSNEALQVLKDVLSFAEETIKSNALIVARLAPTWLGMSVPGIPPYHGDNPYNIHGVDHKYDYLLKPDQKYIANERDLILTMAVSRSPYIPSETDLYNSSELHNIAKATVTPPKDIDEI